MFSVLKKIKNIICYICVILISFAIFIFYKNYYFLLFSFSLIIFGLLSVILGFITIKMLKVNININQIYCEKNVPVNVEFIVKNFSFVPLVNAKLQFKVYNNFYPKDFKNIVDFGITGFCFKQKIVLPLNVDLSGMINVELCNIKGNDFLNFFSYKKKLYDKKSFIVIPERINVDINEDVNSLYCEGTGTTESRSVNDGTEFINVSKFKDGDNIRDIHWKLSVKSNEILVKEFGDDTGDKITLFISVVNAENKGELSEVINTAYSIAYDFLSKNKGFFISWNSHKSEVNIKKEILEYDDLLDAFEQLFYETPKTEIQKVFVPNDQKGSIIYIAPLYEKEIVDAKVIGGSGLVVILEL